MANGKLALVAPYLISYICKSTDTILNQHLLIVEPVTHTLRLGFTSKSDVAFGYDKVAGMFAKIVIVLELFIGHDISMIITSKSFFATCPSRSIFMTLFF